jgi:hypothetical protein
MTSNARTRRRRYSSFNRRFFTCHRTVLSSAMAMSDRCSHARLYGPTPLTAIQPALVFNGNGGNHTILLRTRVRRAANKENCRVELRGVLEQPRIQEDVARQSLSRPVPRGIGIFASINTDYCYTMSV